MRKGLIILFFTVMGGLPPVANGCVVQRFAFGSSVADLQAALPAPAGDEQGSDPQAVRVADRHRVSLPGATVCRSDSRFADAAIDFIFYYDQLTEISVAATAPALLNWFAGRYGSRPAGVDEDSGYTIQRHGALAEYWSEGSAEHVIITSISHERLIHRYYTGDEAARIEGDEKQRLEEERQQQEQNKEIGEGQPPADGEITTIDDVTETGGGQ